MCDSSFFSETLELGCPTPNDEASATVHQKRRHRPSARTVPDGKTQSFLDPSRRTCGYEDVPEIACFVRLHGAAAEILRILRPCFVGRRPWYLPERDMRRLQQLPDAFRSFVGGAERWLTARTPEYLSHVSR